MKAPGIRSAATAATVLGIATTAYLGAGRFAWAPTSSALLFATVVGLAALVTWIQRWTARELSTLASRVNSGLRELTLETGLELTEPGSAPSTDETPFGVVRGTYLGLGVRVSIQNADSDRLVTEIRFPRASMAPSEVDALRSLGERVDLDPEGVTLRLWGKAPLLQLSDSAPPEADPARIRLALERACGAIRPRFRRIGPDDAAREAADVAACEPPATFVVVAAARYLPHGGGDRLALRLRANGGTVERLRWAERRPPQTFERDLSPDESRAIREALEARSVWQLGDCVERIKDGLVCAFAFVQEGRSHGLRLHCAGQCAPRELLSFLTGLAPLASGGGED